MSTFQPHLDASRVDRLLKQSLAELKCAEKNAVLWFGEVLRRKLYRELGYSSIHQYAALELGFSKARTAQFIRLAESLHTLPELSRSLARGDVSWTKAREVARVATPKTETAWIDHARRSTSRELERKVAETQRAARRLRNGSGGQGVLMEATRASLDSVAVPASGGASPKVLPGMSPGMSPGAPPASPSITTPLSLAAEVPVGLQLRFTPAQYARYEALMETLRKQGVRGSREELVLAAMEAAVLAASSSGGETDSARPSGRHAEIVPGPSREAGPKTIADPEAHLEHNAFPRGNSPSPYQVVVQVCERCEAAAVETGRGTLALAPQTLNAILCDAKVRRRGERNRAVIPARVRRGVLERDRFRCRGAGCGNTRFLSVHHLVPREAGGSNLPENLVTLCEACHRSAHRHGT